MRSNGAIAAGGALLFFACCLIGAGGPLATAPFGDVYLYAHYSHLMAQGRWPYRDFFDEYPPLAQPLFLFVRALPGSFEPAFRWTMTVLGSLSVVLLVRTVTATGRRAWPAAAVAGVSPLLVGPIFLNAFDLWPAFLTAAALLAFVLRRERTAYVLLALAVAAKIYPVVLLPIAVVETFRAGGRAAVRRGLVWFGGALVLVNLPFAVMGPGGLRYSYWSQLRRGLEVESLAGALLLVFHHATLVAGLSTNVAGGLANALATVTTLVAAAAVLLVAWIFLRRRNGGFVTAAAASVVAFVAFGKVLSPQYVDWLVPLVPAAGGAAAAILVGVLVLTHVVFDRFHAPGGPNGAHHKAALEWWLLSRDLLLVALYAWLVVRLRRSSATSRT